MRVSVRNERRRRFKLPLPSSRAVYHTATYTSQRKDAPGPSLLTSFSKHIRQGSRDCAGRVKHFLTIVHDAHGAVLWKNNQIHAGEALLGALDNVANLPRILHDFFVRVESRHGVLKDADPDRVCRRRRCCWTEQ